MRRALELINDQIREAAAQNLHPDRAIRLVAVSKLKPTSSIIEAYECGQRFFGENYIQELETKSNSPEIIEKCPDIRWHFIGHLQSNKVNKLLKIRNLHCFETLDSKKLADLINRAIGRHKEGSKQSGAEQSGPAENIQLNYDRLKVFIQVNTSGEPQKSGVRPEDAIELSEHILKNCHWLHLSGLMTIGYAETPSEDFKVLYEVRKQVASHLGVEPLDLELSMGMSDDFFAACLQGSTNVRVGSKIFGQREPRPNKAEVSSAGQNQ